MATLRIFLNARYKLIQLDAKTGMPVAAFGTNGVVDLSEGLVWAINKKHYTNTSPPIIYKDLIIVGNGVGDRLTYKNDPPGDVRAFHARTGKLAWKFNTIPQRGEFGNNTWDGGSWQFTGHTNVWAPMSLDEERGLLYMPVSTPSNDYYGGRRPGQNLFAESIVCLDANTGQRKWHFQIVHHGLWDYDPASAPNLVTITVDGKRIDAVVQLTKQGWAFVFDRVTGRPVWPIEEKPVGRSDVPGEASWPTQPVPTKPPAFESQGVTLDDAFDATPELKAKAVAELKKYRLGPIYTPPSLQGTVALPGVWGGANWGGGAFDPQSGRLFVKTTRSPAIFKMETVQQVHAAGGSARRSGRRIHQSQPFLVRGRRADSQAALRAPGRDRSESRRDRVEGAVRRCAGAAIGAGAQGRAAARPSWRRRAAGRDRHEGRLGVRRRQRHGVVGLRRARRPRSVALRLTEASHRTPMTYLAADGRQIVVIATGRGEDTSLVAFALPNVEADPVMRPVGPVPARSAR